MCDRFKDLRRPEHRRHESRLRRKWTGNRQSTLTVGANSGPSYGISGSPDTFIDGLTVFGCDAVGVYQPSHLTQSGMRTIRHCIVVAFHLNEHATTPLTQGLGSTGQLIENNIGWSTVLSKDNSHPRAQMYYQGGHFRRNLIVYPTGGDYTRMLLMWGNGGLVEGNQLHAGHSFGFTRLTAIKAAGPGDVYDIAKIWVFRDNLIYGPDHLGYHESGIPDPDAGPLAHKGLVFEGNTCYSRKTGFQKHLRMTHRATIRNNIFHLPSEAVTNALPPLDQITVQGGTPIVESNRIVAEQDIPVRPSDLVNLEELARAFARDGDAATLPVADPARNLRAEAVGPGRVNLTWDASVDPSVTGYIIRFGPAPNSWLNPVFVGRTTSAEIRNLAPGKQYFTVAAHKAGFVESWPLSNEVEVSVR
jgi:hypothetical protein